MRTHRYLKSLHPYGYVTCNVKWLRCVPYVTLVAVSNGPGRFKTTITSFTCASHSLVADSTAAHQCLMLLLEAFCNTEKIMRIFVYRPSTVSKTKAQKYRKRVATVAASDLQHIQTLRKIHLPLAYLYILSISL